MVGFVITDCFARGKMAKKFFFIMRNILLRLIKISGVLTLLLLLIICFALAIWRYNRYTEIKKCVAEGKTQQWCEQLWEEIDALD